MLTAEEQEAADRAAIEETWVRFWAVYTEIIRTPEQERAPLLETVAVDPVAARILDAAAQLSGEGVDYFGAPKLNPFWKASVNGQGVAEMRDCQDQSQYGSVFVETGDKRSIGRDRFHVRGQFERDLDGKWRLFNLQHVDDAPC